MAMSVAVYREVGREAWHGLTRNAFRAALSMLGIAWGIVSVVMLLAYGNGFHDAVAAGFRGAFGSGVAVIWPGQTITTPSPKAPRNPRSSAVWNPLP